MIAWVIGSLVISFFLARNLFADVATGWIVYAIVNSFAPDWAILAGSAVAILGVISTPSH
ncbi:hypothetical protein [Rodentibacter genomosp. 2]|uniref:Uncharacterized protein n=1 Tax=Rodentibacter genomosp. 2 TaxID=1908266 RepID=A0A1V3JNE3_9PAST|nr:hypothetical protein [Rodentibacter genomosp. 2]OOF57762.1 hypothetical protein BKK55_03465 [Rodentibacter genomosp. 2]